jgi:hypothetical protein
MGGKEDDIDNINDNEYHHDTSDDEEPRPRKAGAGSSITPAIFFN